ncbi:Uncharacterized protein EJ110_NYTH36361 [Nymphaea thermarum]|nr:Uncharacterized protein EJ110_NYTH36361 [Nymphaea thermarum]
MVGISFLVGLKAATFLLAFVCLRHFSLTFLSVPFLHASFVAFLVSVASHPFLNLPLLFAKSSDGRFPLWSLIIFGPYLVFIRIFVYLRRLKRREPLYNEIFEGVYVGGWPSSFDSVPPGELAILDCTCELPRSSLFSKNAYMCIPTWDTRAPRPSEIELAVRWACRKRAQNKSIYIHCAFGHGRSVCVLCALLVALGVADNCKEAEKIVRKRRPSICLNSLHHGSLEEWSRCRISSQKGGTGVSSMMTKETKD